MKHSCPRWTAHREIFEALLKTTFEPTICKASGAWHSAFMSLLQRKHADTLFLAFGLGDAILAKPRLLGEASPDQATLQEMLRLRDLTSLGQPSLCFLEHSCASIHVGSTSASIHVVSTWVHPALQSCRLLLNLSDETRIRRRLWQAPGWADLARVGRVSTSSKAFCSSDFGRQAFEDVVGLQQLLEFLLFMDASLISTWLHQLHSAGEENFKLFFLTAAPA